MWNAARQEVEQWREKFVLLQTEMEREQFDKEFLTSFDSKNEESKEEFRQAFRQGAMDECDRAEKIIKIVTLRRKLDKVLQVVSMSYIAEHYFKKDSSWLSQRLNLNIVDGVPISFTEDELKILSNALNEIGDQLKESAETIYES